MKKLKIIYIIVMFLITICVFPSMYYLNHYLKLKSEVNQLQYVYVYDFAENLYNYKYGKDYHKSNSFDMICI